MKIANYAAVNKGMPVNGKRKGNGQERKLARLLSERFAHRTGMVSSFRRSSDSGSYFGGRNRERLATHDVTKATFGDIVTPEGFRFTVESKFYKDAPSYNQIVSQSCAMFDDWIEQAEADAISAGKPPLIVAKFNNVPEAVLVDQSLASSPVSYRGYSILPLADALAFEDGWWFK